MMIEKMTQVHVAQIAQLEKLCFSDPWSEKSIAAELDCRLSCWLVALDREKVIGYVGSQTVIDESDMMNIAVHPDFRRQGVAEALVGSLSDALRLRGSKALTLEVRVSNVPAIRLYQKLGFGQVGRRPNYYRNPKEDALILRKAL